MNERPLLFNPQLQHELPKEEERKLAIPTYDPNSQFTVEALQAEYPEWAENYDGDAVLTAIGYERTRAIKTLGRESNSAISFVTAGRGLIQAIDHLPKEVGLGYDAHGIAGKQDPVAELDQLLKNGIQADRPFYTMSLVTSNEAAGALGADRPFTTGGLIVVSDYGKKLRESGIAYVLVGEEYSRAIDLFRGRYPSVTFVPWNDVSKTLTKRAGEVEGREIPVVEIPDEDRRITVRNSMLPRRAFIPENPTPQLPDVAGLDTSEETPDVW